MFLRVIDSFHMTPFTSFFLQDPTFQQDPTSIHKCPQTSVQTRKD